MRGIALRVAIVSLAVMGLYTLFANSIPQIESRPPEDLIITGEGLSGEELAKAGEKLFYGKGTCAVCHSIGAKGARAPDLAGVGGRAGERKPGMSDVKYLFESLINPGAYLVEGYGNIMPAVHKPPVSLNESEMLAMVAFLQSLGGTVTVTRQDIPPEVREARGEPAAAAPGPAVVAGDKEKGALIFGKLCAVCHVVKGKGGTVGPDLTSIGATKDEGYIRESILTPGAVIAEGYPPVMPPNFAEQLTVKEFNDVVAYLASLKKG